MDVSLVLPRSLRIPILFAGLVFVFALGCNGPSVPAPIDINVEAQSCVEGALSMSFDIVASNALFPATYQYGSPNVIPIPTITGSSTSFHVTADLDTVAVNDAVSMTFSSSAFPNTTTSIQNIQFYTVPAAQQVSGACPPEHGPVIGTNDLPGIGFHLEVSNPGPDPIALTGGIEMAEVPALSPPGEVHRYGNGELCDWQFVCPSGIVLAPGAPPLVFDLPDTPTFGTHGVMMRYSAHSGGGGEQYVLMQVDLVGSPVKVSERTWGAVKALYRKDN